MGASRPTPAAAVERGPGPEGSSRSAVARGLSCRPRRRSSGAPTRSSTRNAGSRPASPSGCRPGCGANAPSIRIIRPGGWCSTRPTSTAWSASSTSSSPRVHAGSAPKPHSTTCSRFVSSRMIGFTVSIGKVVMTSTLLFTLVRRRGARRRVEVERPIPSFAVVERISLPRCGRSPPTRPPRGRRPDTGPRPSEWRRRRPSSTRR